MARLNDINTTEILDAIRLGCRTMCNVFNADDNDIPFFAAMAWPDPWMSFCDFATESHVPGRHLNALLTAREVTGIPVDDDVIQKHARAAFLSFSGPVPLPLNRQRIGGKPIKLHSHNIREGLHAMFALTKYCHSDPARKMAEKCIEFVFEYLDPVKGLDVRRMGEKFGLDVFEVDRFVQDLGRMIGPLVKFYRETGYGRALELAIVLKDRAVREFFTEDGAFDFAKFGLHTHSITSSLSSLAQLADLTSDSKLLERVKAFYDHGLNSFRDQLGWAAEAILPDANPDRGEANTSGDIVETALILGRWGHPEYYEDAERIVRCHLLPSQLRDISFVKKSDNPQNGDGRRNVANRLRGAWGFASPYGHLPLGMDTMCFNLDVVGGVVGSLCEVYKEITTEGATGHRVNLHFDHETPAIKAASPYTHTGMTITLKQPGPLWVRIPSWVKPEDVNVTGISTPFTRTNGYVVISQPPVHQPIRVTFPLTEREMILMHRKRTIRTRLRGDQVLAMENFRADFTFFEPLC